MKVKYVDNLGYFGDGYYTAKITKFEPFKTSYGNRILIWLEITNEHDRRMSISDFLPTECTGNNTLAKVYNLTCPGNKNKDFNTDEMIGKFLGVTLCKKIKRHKTYLNVTNYLPIKEDLRETSKSKSNITEQAIVQLATILKNNPTLASAVVKEIRKEPRKDRIPKKKKGASPLGEIIDDLKNKK